MKSRKWWFPLEKTPSRNFINEFFRALKIFSSLLNAWAWSWEQRWARLPESGSRWWWKRARAGRSALYGAPRLECECQTRQTVHSSYWGRDGRARAEAACLGLQCWESSQITLRRKSSTTRGGDTHLWGKRYTIFKETHSQGTVDCKDSGVKQRLAGYNRGRREEQLLWK